MSVKKPVINQGSKLNNDPVPKNEAAWLVAQDVPLQVKEAPYLEPQAGEILVINHAVAVNPVDWMIPYLGKRVFSWIKYPFVLGSDLAGEVVAVGSTVTHIKIGDRVLAMAAGSAKQRNRAAEGAFQAYSIVLPQLTTVIPDHLSYLEAAVIPLGLTTAACGLFQKDTLALEWPTVNAKPRDQWVIVAGGATSVGSNAIQLAVAAGYSVATTASPKNFEYVKSLGAALAFDYKKKGVVKEITVALKGKYLMGALSIGAGSTDNCIDILAHSEGRKFVGNISSPVPFGDILDGRAITFSFFLTILPGILKASIKTWFKARRQRVTVKFFDSSTMIDNEIGRYIYQDYLGKALATGSFLPAPKPEVVGHGLHDIQAALDLQKKGVSASKVVIELISN